MSESKEARILIGEAMAEIIAEARGGVRKIPVGLMAYGSEVGSAEALAGARLAMKNDPCVKPVLIGPKIESADDVELIETEANENAVSRAMECALEEGKISAAVALHYPFPLGVATIGKVMTPAKGRACYIASSTGTSAAGRVEAMVRNAIYGIAAAKADGVDKPTVGLINLDGAQTALRALEKLRDGGYDIEFASSVRKDGGAILRGNDLLAGSADVFVADTLTGNVLMKLFSSWNTGGEYEALGWGYGPSVGEGWGKVISIISRASGAPVIANALSLSARSAANGLPEIAAEEIKKANNAGLDEIISSLQAKAPASAEEVKAPPAEPTDEELHGIDVLSIEDAVKALWKKGVYAESSMGCTGPVIKIAAKNSERAEEILKSEGYL